jgi:hypothetical protein
MQPRVSRGAEIKNFDEATFGGKSAIFERDGKRRRVEDHERRRFVCTRCGGRALSIMPDWSLPEIPPLDMRNVSL